MRMWFGMICFALVALIAWAMIVVGLGPEPTPGHGGGGKVIACAVYAVAFWLLLFTGYAAMVCGGGLDWLGIGRGWQYTLACIVAFGIAFTMMLAAGLYTEPIDQLPYVFQPIIRWAMFVLPVIAIAAGVLALDAGWRDFWPVAVTRGPQLAAGFVVIAIAIGLSAQLVIESRRHEAWRARQAVADDQVRSREFLDEVRAADPVRDFGRLLGHTGIYEDEDIRNLALEKLRANPNFTDALVTALRNGWPDGAITYVAWNDVPDPDKVAPAVKDAIEAVANGARRQMREAHYLWNDYFDSRSERILATADRLAGHGVNFVPAVAAFRAALDEPRQQKIAPNCLRELNAWLNRNAEGTQ